MSLENYPKPKVTTIINNKKTLLSSEVFLQKYNNTSPLGLNQANLLKYFPKYIHKLEIGVLTRPVISKVKRVKILHILRDQGENQNKALRRTLLYNKERHIQSILHNEKCAWGPEIRAFTGLQTLKLLSGYFFRSSLAQAEELFNLKRFCQSIKGLSQLQHLSLQIDSFSSLDLISRINSCKRLLKTLKTLKIRIIWDPWEYDDDLRYFTTLLKNKNILENITHLHPNCIEIRSTFQVFQEILTSCPKLISLRLETKLEKSKENPLKNQVTVDSQYLQALETFSALQTINIDCRHIWTLSRYFTLPPSIQNVKLNFLSLFEASDFFSESNIDDLPQIWTGFCDKWTHLTNLKTVKIRLSKRMDPHGLNLLLIQHWLKRISSLQNLDLEFSSLTNSSHWKEMPDQGDFDFSVFLESIQHLKNTLQTLIISDKSLVYRLKNLSLQPFGFPYLQKFCLQGFISQEEFNISRLKDLMTREIEPFDIVLDGLIFDSLQFLLGFLKSFDQEISGEKRVLKVDIVAYLRNEIPKKKSDGRKRFCSRFFLLSQTLSIQVRVLSEIKFTQETDPKCLLQNHLDFLTLVG